MATPQEVEDPVARLEEVWRSRRGLVHIQMSFTRAKELAHRIFDDADVPRPFVKCIPANNHSRGFAMPKHEIFIPELPYAGALIEVCAELILGVLEPHQSENRVADTRISATAWRWRIVTWIGLPMPMPVVRSMSRWAKFTRRGQPSNPAIRFTKLQSATDAACSDGMASQNR